MGIFLYNVAVGVIPLILRQMRQHAIALPIRMGVVYMVIPYFAYLSLFYIALHVISIWSELPDPSVKREKGIK
jgi:TRAP-type C4-dicarboxylate transport system permease small subunit